MANTYGNNYFGFGSKEAYAKAIKEKLQSGQELTNKAAAEQFMKENPELFEDVAPFGGSKVSGSGSTKTDSGNVPLRSTLESQGYSVQFQGVGKPLVVSKGGQNYQITNYTLQNGTAYVPSSVLSGLSKQHSLVPIRSTVEGKNLDVTYDPTSGNVTVTHPVSKESYTIQPNLIVGGKAYTTQEELDRAVNRVTPGYEKAYQEGQAALNEYLSRREALDRQFLEEQRSTANKYIDTMNKYMQQYQEAGLAMLKQYQEQYSQAMTQLQQYLNPNPEIPESVKLAIDMLKQQLDENIRVINNELNRRGVYDSRSAVRAIQKARESMGQQQAQILADWLDNQHKQMFQAAMQLANMQANFASNYANLYGQAYLKPLELGMNMAKEGFALQQNLSQQQYNMQRELAETGFNVAQGLYDAFVKGEDALKAELRKQEIEQAKQILEALKWQQDYALKQAQLAETQRHNIAMENRPTDGGNAFTPWQIYQIQQQQEQEQATKEYNDKIENTALNLGIDTETARFIVDNEALIKNNPDAAKMQVTVMAGRYPGMNTQFVLEYIDSLHKPAETPQKTLWERIVEGLRSGTPYDVYSQYSGIFP